MLIYPVSSIHLPEKVMQFSYKFVIWDMFHNHLMLGGGDMVIVFHRNMPVYTSFLGPSTFSKVPWR